MQSVRTCFLRKPRQDFPSPSPEHYFLSGGATATILRTQDAPCLERVWLSLLVTPGCLLFKRGAPASEISYVVGVTSQYVKLWAVTAKVKDGQMYVLPAPPPGRRPWSLEPIFDLLDWRVQDTAPLPPCVVREARPDDGRPIGVILSVPSVDSFPLLLHAAQRGFANLTSEHLKKLLELLDVDFPKMPSLEYDRARLLIRHCWPGCTDMQLANALENRVKLKLPKFETSMTAADVEAASELLGDADVNEMKKTVFKYLDQVKRYKEEIAVAAKAKAKPKGVKRKVMAAKDHAAVASAQTYLPQGVVGCSISLETEWHQRWRATYTQRLQAPYVNTAVFHDDNSKRLALNFVLQWVWDSHTAKNPTEVCPWQFEV